MLPPARRPLPKHQRAAPRPGGLSSFQETAQLRIFMNPQQIRDHYLSRLRSLFRLIRKLESLYPDAYPDAPADAWRAAIEHVAARIKSAPDSELQEMAGSHLALRNMVAL